MSLFDWAFMGKDSHYKHSQWPKWLPLVWLYRLQGQNFGQRIWDKVCSRCFPTMLSMIPNGHSQWTFQRQLALMKDVINVHITILSVYYLAQFAISTSFNNWFKNLKKRQIVWRIDQTIFFRVFFPWVKSQVSIPNKKNTHTHNPRGALLTLGLKWSD
jgi:hypothetical protein